MSPEPDTVDLDIEQWVERARNDPHKYLERQATEVLLAAICASTGFGDKLYLKGGTLMGLLYQSPRQTADLDFTAGFEPTENLETDLRASLNPKLRRVRRATGVSGSRVSNPKHKETTKSKALCPSPVPCP